jgi:hypothetical protein
MDSTVAALDPPHPLAFKLFNNRADAPRDSETYQEIYP